MLQINFLKQIYVCPLSAWWIPTWSSSYSGMLHNLLFLFIHHFLILPHIVHRPPPLHLPHMLALPIYFINIPIFAQIFQVLPFLIFLFFPNVPDNVLLILLGQHVLICTTQIPKGPRCKIKGMSEFGLKKNYIFTFNSL